MTLLWDFDCGSFDNFQSYKSRQINPDEGWMKYTIFLIREFQSYQSRLRIIRSIGLWNVRFNRINPDSSIPTRNYALIDLASLIGFQSYQSKQINPNRSIPTPKDFYFPNKPNEKFQSYQSRQINLDRSIPTKEWVFRKFSYN